ncbi:hypothetical protein ANTQUA_LOCUS640 [Anthophora quadrimaculata]
MHYQPSQEPQEVVDQTAHAEQAATKSRPSTTSCKDAIESMRAQEPDLVANCGNAAVVIDAQVVSEQADLIRAHKNKINYYQKLKDAIVTEYEVQNVKFTFATLR